MYINKQKYKYYIISTYNIYENVNLTFSFVIFWLFWSNLNSKISHMTIATRML